MKAILIIEDNPESSSGVEINVMRHFTSAETEAGIGQFDTLASKYLLVIEGMLMELRRQARIHNTEVLASSKKAAEPPKESSQCLH